MPKSTHQRSFNNKLEFHASIGLLTSAAIQVVDIYTSVIADAYYILDIYKDVIRPKIGTACIHEVRHWKRKICTMSCFEPKEVL